MHPTVLTLAIGALVAPQSDDPSTTTNRDVVLTPPGAASASAARPCGCGGGGAPLASTTLYDNGDTDGSAGYSNATTLVFGARRTLLDDFTIPSDTWILDALDWKHIWNGAQVPPFGTGFELTFRKDATGAPGPITALTVQTGYTETATGNVWFSRPEAASHGTFTPVALSPGAYWIEAVVLGGDENLWMVHAGVTGSEAWVNYEDMGGLQPASAVYGGTADLDFELSGSVSTGSSCTLYSNGDTDGSNGFSNATANVLGSRRALLDDFTVPPNQSWDISSLTWTHVWAGGQTAPFGTGVELEFRDDAGGMPGTSGGLLPISIYSELPTGKVFFGLPEAISTARFDKHSFAAGTYWIEATVIGADNDFWLVKQDIVGNPCWLDYDEFGGLVSTQTLYGVPSDLNFRLGGTATTIGVRYCTALPNSTGFPGEITARGSIVAADNNVQLVACNLPQNQFAYFLNGLVQANVPVGSGILCIGGEIGRFAKQVADTGNAGLIVTQIDLSKIPRPSGGPHLVVAGETWLFQAWHRDGSTSNFTPGLEITFQ